MGHNIPVFYAPIDERDVHDETMYEQEQPSNNWLNETWERMENNGLRTCTSRGWWIQWSLEAVCKHLSINGLEFVQEVVVCLNQQEISNKIQTIDILLSKCKHGIPISGIKYDDMIGFLLYEEKDKKISKQQTHNAYIEAKAQQKIQAWSANGYDALVELFSFLKSLRATMQDCLEQDRYLFYFQPQP